MFDAGNNIGYYSIKMNCFSYFVLFPSFFREEFYFCQCFFLHVAREKEKNTVRFPYSLVFGAV